MKVVVGVALALLLPACGSDPASGATPAGATPGALKPTDGRAMGIARLDYEKCDAVFQEVSGSWTGRLLSSQGSDLAARLGPPDGVRANGDRYWLAVDRAGDCNELVVSSDGSFGEGSASQQECGLPGGPTRRTRRQAASPAGSGDP